MVDLRPYRILVIHEDAAIRARVMTVLQDRDYRLASAHSIDHARRQFSEWPIDMVVTGPRLQGTRGLDFFAAMRQHYPELVCLLVADARDEPMELDAWRHGASLIVSPFEAGRLLMLVAETLASIRRRQRWPRKRVGRHVTVKIGKAPGRLVDVSYGGLRFEFAGESYELPSPMTIDFPDARMQVRANLVWSSRAEDGVSSVCGAGIIGDIPGDTWRHFVDDLPPAEQHA